MPIVSATDVPYGPGLVGNLPQAPTAVPGDYQRIPTEPAMFGALQGQALEKVGTTLETASDRLAARAIEAQTLHNEISAHGAFNNTQDTSTNILYGSPDNPGYFTLQGKDALDQYPVVRDKLTKLYADARNTLQNPHQQLIFDNEARRNLNYQLASLGRHYDAQQKVLAKETNATSYDQNLQGAMNAEQNSPEEAERIHGMMTAALDQLKEEGRLQIPGAVDGVIGKVRADVTKGWAQKLGVHDAIAAAQFVEQNKDVLGTHYPALANEFRQKAIEQGARQAAEGAVGGPAVGPAPTGPVNPQQYTDEANKQGVDPRLVHATASIESSYGKNTGNTVSPSNTGIFQRAPANAPGGQNDSYENQIRLGVQDLAKERSDLRDKIGREPTNAEVYLAHQQGPTGAAWLLTHPNERAGNIPRDAPGAASGDVKISNNGGDPNAPASAFVAKWQKAYASHEAKFTNLAAAAPAPPAMGPTTTGEPVAPTIPPPAPPAPAPKTLAQVEEDARNNATEIARRGNFDPDATQQTIDQAIAHARTKYNLTTAAIRQADLNNETIAKAQVIAGNNGEPFRDMGAYLADPARAELFHSLKPDAQGSIRKYVTDYATAHVPVTPDRLKRYDELRGMAGSSPGDFLGIDILKEDLPNNMKTTLLGERNRIVKGMQAPPDTAKAMATLTSMGIFEGTGIDKTNDPETYHHYYAQLDDAIKEFKLKNAKSPDHDDIVKMGQDLLQVSIPGSWFFNYGETRKFETLVPKDESEAIVRDYRAKFNATPTPAQVLAMYHQKLKANAGARTAVVPPPQAPQE
jgi:hypothetical protein